MLRKYKAGPAKQSKMPLNESDGYNLLYTVDKAKRPLF